MFLPSKHLLSAFYKTLPSKNASVNLVFTKNPLHAPSKNPAKKHLLFENLLRTLLRSVLFPFPQGKTENATPALLFGQKACFRGGGGVVYFEPLSPSAEGILCPPPPPSFIHPPAPRRVCSGVREWGKGHEIATLKIAKNDAEGAIFVKVARLQSEFCKNDPF